MPTITTIIVRRTDSLACISILKAKTTSKYCPGPGGSRGEFFKKNLWKQGNKIHNNCAISPAWIGLVDSRF